jgi:hypothetical protein
MHNPLQTKPDVDHLVTLLRAACEDAGMNSTLEKLLSQPEERRHLLVRELLAEFRAQQAPAELIAAFTPLLDDDVADTAWRVIYQCGANH